MSNLKKFIDDREKKKLLDELERSHQKSLEAFSLTDEMESLKNRIFRGLGIPSDYVNLNNVKEGKCESFNK